VLAAQADGHDVTTIEGQATATAPYVQEAFVRPARCSAASARRASRRRRRRLLRRAPDLSDDDP
jgi:aerobic-type carbon monoxide dehydrogenase small subunit (CoxS/CutS family)